MRAVCSSKVWIKPCKTIKRMCYPPCACTILYGISMARKMCVKSDRGGGAACNPIESAWFFSHPTTASFPHLIHTLAPDGHPLPNLTPPPQSLLQQLSNNIRVGPKHICSPRLCPQTVAELIRFILPSAGARNDPSPGMLQPHQSICTSQAIGALAGSCRLRKPAGGSRALIP